MHFGYPSHVIPRCIFLSFLAVVLSQTVVLFAQEDDDQIGLAASNINGGSSWDNPNRHDFFDEDGDLVVAGQLIKMEGKTVTIRTDEKGPEKFNLRFFSKVDQTWIRRRIAELKKIESKKLEASKLVIGLASNKPRIVIETLKRLRTYGSAASHLTMQLEPLMISKNIKTRNTAFVCYVGIAPISNATINRIARLINDSKTGFGDAIDNNPRQFVLSLSRYREFGLPYLRAIAFKGKTVVQPADQAEIAADELVPGSSNAKIRAYACQAIAETKLGEEAADILTEVLSSQVDDSNSDAKTIGKTIEAIGKLGFKSDMLVDILNDQKDELADVVKKALMRIEKSNSK